jgi:hypothetical protein
MKVQIASVDVARNYVCRALLSGMAKCASRHLIKGPAAAEVAQAAVGPGRPGAAGAAGAEPPPDADSVTRVADYLKTKVKAGKPPNDYFQLALECL